MCRRQRRRRLKVWAPATVVGRQNENISVNLSPRIVKILVKANPPHLSPAQNSMSDGIFIISLQLCVGSFFKGELEKHFYFIKR